MRICANLCGKLDLFNIKRTGMDTKNKNFAIAIEEIKKRYRLETQNEVSEFTHISVDTLTRIKQDSPVTEKQIKRLQVATGNLFNIAWLRGESNIMLSASVRKDANGGPISTSQPVTTPSIDAVVSVIAAAKDETISALRSQVEEYQRQLADYRQQVSESHQQVSELRQQVSELRQQVASLSAQLESCELDSFNFSPGVSDPKQGKRI